MQVQPKKKFGQNFLVSQHHLNLLSDCLNDFLLLAKPSSVFEIGPGEGALTKLISKLYAGNILALEVDPEAINFLNTELALLQNVQIELEQVDALECFTRLNQKNLKSPSKTDLTNPLLKLQNDFALVSNLPYNIASRILVELTLFEPTAVGFLVMLQKEVAEKIILKNGKLNLLGAYLNLYWELKIVGKYPRSTFRPQPKVESALLQATKKQPEHPKFKNRQNTLTILKNLFTYPSKTLVNNLKNLGWNTTEIAKFYETYSLKTNTRLESDNYLEILDKILGFQFKKDS
jgi:16S rRNA (adenine1518-N6/adenine1519-N6)-dimethyltransferase